MKELEQLMDLVGVNASEVCKLNFGPPILDSCIHLQEEVQAMVEEIDTTGAGEIQFQGEFCL